jgi:hypothetical protein
MGKNGVDIGVRVGKGVKKMTMDLARGRNALIGHRLTSIT